MNEQRKVIYARRNEILNGEDLKDETSEFLALEIDEIISSHCSSEYQEDWDLDALVVSLGNLWPNEFTSTSFKQVSDSNDIYELAMEDVLQYCEQRETLIGHEVMRKVEGQIMLRILDQRWREHLYAMDYLKEGIHLRAMGQKDPLTEWQREGFEMFGSMMDSVGKDFIKYITHIQIDNEQETEQGGSLDRQASDVSYSGTDEIAAGAIASLAQQKPSASSQPEIPATQVKENTASKQSTIVKSEFEKTGRNEPCPCGSGKKFKQCCGK